jgi:hypothetical protein
MNHHLVTTFHPHHKFICLVIDDLAKLITTQKISKSIRLIKTKQKKRNKRKEKKENSVQGRTPFGTSSFNKSLRFLLLLPLIHNS